MSGRGAWRPMSMFFRSPCKTKIDPISRRSKEHYCSSCSMDYWSHPIFTFSAMSIAGSATTTPGMQNVFIGQIAKVGTDGSKIGGLRFGYMGICAYVGVEGSNGDTFKNTNGFQCIGKQYSQSPDEIAATLHVDSNIIQLGQKLQNDISIFMPMVALSLFLLGFLVDTGAWLLAGLGKPAGKIGHAYTLTVSVNAINTVLGDTAVGCSANVQIEQGKTLEGLQWAAFAFALLFSFGIYMVTRDTMYGFNIAPRARSRGRRMNDAYPDEYSEEERSLSYER
ncbi:uncharacterized protein EAF02_002970 [Botrytis sinoallii]|uniref:uncharacterized protein n=1 Tax=Botrytis sinoallii TaxID=1463999 RepID=UPI0019029D66|nr:uncharacterized protein EAF02_002970 [Botrytis sinoallii]KAF7888429.1 hypothetical protein EAF02_002970 [Botrytis sinoallii]